MRFSLSNYTGHQLPLQSLECELFFFDQRVMIMRGQLLTVHLNDVQVCPNSRAGLRQLVTSFGFEDLAVPEPVQPVDR